MRSVDLKFCIDVDFLESTITLGFIKNMSSCDDLLKKNVRTFLKERAQESKSAVTLQRLDKIVKDEPRKKMKKSDAKARMQDLLASYCTILRRHGLNWLIRENQKVSDYHVFLPCD